MTAKSKSQDDLLKMGSARNRKWTTVESFGLSTSSPLAQNSSRRVEPSGASPRSTHITPAWIFVNRSIVERSYQFIFLLKISVTFKRSVRRLCHQLTPFHKINTGPPFPRLYNVFVLYIYAYIYTTRYSSSHQEACFI